MIIYRYLSRELLISTLSVGFVLSIILISGRFLKYMAEAASGDIEGWAVMVVLAYRLPEFLQLILPLSLFLGVLLAYGRMYVDYEMTVLKACGFGPWRLLKMTLIPALCMAFVVGFFSLQLTPWGNKQSNALLVEQYTRSPLELLTPGKFLTFDKGKVVYAKEINSDKTELTDVFTSTTQDGKFVTVLAKKGRRILDERTNAQYMIMSEGYRNESIPGGQSLNVIAFETYTYKIKEPDKTKERKSIQSKKSKDLMESSNPAEIAEFQWRLSLAPLSFIIVMLAVPLSKVNPRQGRFLKLLPAILLYLSYVALLVVTKDAIEKGDIGVYPGVWTVHLLFLFIGLIIIQWESIHLYWLKRKGKRQENSIS